MLRGSAAGIRAPGRVGDKIAAKEKGKNAGRQRRQTGWGGGGSGGDKRRQKWREMALSAADAYVYLKQTIVGPKRICIIYINYLLIHIN